MKKIFAFSLAIAALFAVSCQKEKTPVAQNKTVTVNATFEPVGAGDTKITIAESGSNFALNFEGTETMTVANGTESSTSNFTIASYSGTTATFTGVLPETTATTTDYYGVISTFGSATTTAPAKIRAAIADSQDYDGANIAKNCCLVAKAANCETGTLTSLSFKTMNAFLKLSLIKGAAASGSSNDYTAGMNVQSIVVETENGENISGRFGILKSDDFSDPVFSEEVSGNVFPKVTLNCATSGKINGVGLGSTATDFYIAIKPGTYAKGLKVTINVKNKDGKDGKFVRYISKNTSFDVARNTMVDMPDLTVNPADVAAATTTYTLVESALTDWSGDYLLVAENAGTYYAWKGVFGSWGSCAAVTSAELSSDKKVITPGASSDIKPMTVTSTTGGYKLGYGSSYLAYSAGKFNSGTAAVFTFSLDSAGKAIIATTSGDIRYNHNSGSGGFRTYASTSGLAKGIYLYKKD